MAGRVRVDVLSCFFEAPPQGMPPCPAAPSAPTCDDARTAPSSPSPPTSRQARLRRDRNGGRLPAFDPEAYKHRNTVERAINRLRQHRAVATRCDKRDFTWRGTIDVASIRIWFRYLARQDLRDTR